MWVDILVWRGAFAPLLAEQKGQKKGALKEKTFFIPPKENNIIH